MPSFLCMLSRETLKGGRRSRGTQRTTNFRARCSLPRKWQPSSLLPAPPRPAWDPGFTHQSSSVSAPRPHEYSTPMFSPALSESSLDYDSVPGPLSARGPPYRGVSLYCPSAYRERYNSLSFSSLPRRGIALGTSGHKIGGLSQYNGSHLPSCFYEKMHVSGNARTDKLMLNEHTCIYTSTKQRGNIFSSSVEGNAKTPSHFLRRERITMSFSFRKTR